MTEYVSFSKYWARFTGETAWGLDVLVFLKGKPCKELGLGSPGQPLVTSLQGHVFVYVCFCEQTKCILCVCFYGALSAAAEGLWTSRVPMSGCWDSGRLGSRGQALPKASCWTDTHGTNIHMYTYIYLLLMDLPADQPDRGRDSWGCLCLCQDWSACLCWSACPVVCIRVLYVCSSVCAYWEFMQSWGKWTCDILTSIRSLDFKHKNIETIIYICFTLEMGLEVRNLYFSLSFSWIITTPAGGFASPASEVKSLPHSVIIIST